MFVVWTVDSVRAEVSTCDVDVGQCVHCDRCLWCGRLTLLGQRSVLLMWTLGSVSTEIGVCGVDG